MALARGPCRRVDDAVAFQGEKCLLLVRSSLRSHKHPDNPLWPSGIHSIIPFTFDCDEARRQAQCDRRYQEKSGTVPGTRQGVCRTCGRRIQQVERSIYPDEKNRDAWIFLFHVAIMEERHLAARFTPSAHAHAD